MQPSSEDKGLAWQIGVWDRLAQPYEREVDRRFTSVVEGVVQRAGLQAGEQVLDLGAGTGAVAIRAASLVGAAGHVFGMDISGEMLARARAQAAAHGLRNVTFREGRAEAIPGDSSCCDVLLASLSLMYVIDRAAAAREIARVLRPGGRFVAAVWAGPAEVRSASGAHHLTRCVRTAFAGMIQVPYNLRQLRSDGSARRVTFQSAMRTWIRLWVVATSALSVAACGSPAQPTALITSIAIDPDISVAVVGHPEQLRITANDGVPPSGPPASWSSSVPAVMAVDATGKMMPMGNGVTTITASFRGLTASRVVRVVPDFGGAWSGTYRRLRCMTNDEFYCIFGRNAPKTPPIGVALTQNRDQVTGTLALEAFAGGVTGTITSDGGLQLAGVLAPGYGGPERAQLTRWNTLLADAGRLTGQFSTHWSGFDYFVRDVDAEIVVLERSGR